MAHSFAFLMPASFSCSNCFFFGSSLIKLTAFLSSSLCVNCFHSLVSRSCIICKSDSFFTCIIVVFCQRAVLLPALEGQDIIARAKTGTGKTLAFGIPIIKRLSEGDEGRRKSRFSKFYYHLSLYV